MRRRRAAGERRVRRARCWRRGVDGCVRRLRRRLTGPAASGRHRGQTHSALRRTDHRSHGRSPKSRRGLSLRGQNPASARGAKDNLRRRRGRLLLRGPCVLSAESGTSLRRSSSASWQPVARPRQRTRPARRRRARGARTPRASSLVAPMSLAQARHGAVRLDDGRLLVVGGAGAGELYDVAANKWSMTAPNPVRWRIRLRRHARQAARWKRPAHPLGRHTSLAL